MQKLKDHTSSGSPSSESSKRGSLKGQSHPGVTETNPLPGIRSGDVIIHSDVADSGPGVSVGSSASEASSLSSCRSENEVIVGQTILWMSAVKNRSLLSFHIPSLI